MTTRQKMAIVALMALTARGAVFAQQAEAAAEEDIGTARDLLDTLIGTA